MSYQYGTKRCPVCEARIRAAFCSSTCREADRKGITREAQLAIEMNRRPWSSWTIGNQFRLAFDLEHYEIASQRDE
jgi:hypothetical protein